MNTINDIIDMMYDKVPKEHCIKPACDFCRKLDFCWFDSLRIAESYIEREGQI